MKEQGNDRIKKKEKKLTGVPQGNCPSLKEIKGNFWPKLRKIEEFFHLN